MRIKLFILCIVAICSFQHKCYSQDIIGGEFTIIHSSQNTYECYVLLYTKISSGIDRQFVHLSWVDGLGYELLPRIADSLLSNDVRLNLYFGAHIYPGPGTYTITLLDSFRISGISNIQNSATEPFYQQKQLIINPFIGSTSSSYFNSLQTDIISNNGIISHNGAAIDIDNDSLSYELILCNTAGYYLPPTSNILTIDSITGLFIWDSPLSPGLYQFCIKVTEWRNGMIICENIRDMVIAVDSLTPIHEFADKNRTSIFPNPTNGILFFKNFSNDLKNIIITDISGSKMYEKYTTDQMFQIDISSFRSGVYILKVKENDKVTINKIVLTN